MTTARRWAWTGWGLGALGLARTLGAQLDGVRRGAPFPVGLLLYSCAPFVILALGLRRLAHTTTRAVMLTVTALLLWFWAGTITNDELGLSYWFGPLYQLVTALLGVLGVWAHAVWFTKDREASRRSSS
jgi:hypothetical protein